MANDDTSGSSALSVKLTAYGYPGDSTPDAYSSEGIGDHDNKLEASPDHQSVALTHAQRLREFGYERIGANGVPYSTGKSFEYGGKTYWDEDTAPEGDYRIDVYNPNHPPDKLTLRSGQESTSSSKLSLSGGSDQSALTTSEPPPEFSEQTDSYSDPPAQEDQKPQVGKPDDSILAPQNMVAALMKQHPVYAKSDPQKLWDAFKQKYPTGLQQLRAVFPQYAKVEDNKFLKAVKEKYFAQDSDDEFIDRVNPPSGVAGFYHSIAEQAPRIVSGWFGGTSEVGKFPERFQNAVNQAVIALGIDKKPILTHDQELVQKRLEALGYKESGQLTPTAKGLLSGIIDPKVAQEITGWAMRQAKAGEQYTQSAHIPKPQGIAGQAAAKGFESLGAAPAIVPAFMPGVEAAPALVLGMIYDAVQGEGKAREKGLDNSLMFGAEGLSYRVLQQWFMYTPRGRMLSALLWAGGGMADQEAQALLADPQGELHRAFTQPVNTAADLLSTGAVNALFGGLASMGVDKFKPEARAAFEEARTARAEGDYKQAAQLMDRTMLLLPEPVRKAATNNLLAWRNEAIEARPGDAPLEMPGQRGFLVLKGRAPESDVLLEGVQGGTEMRSQTVTEEPKQEEQLPYPIRQLEKINPKAAENWKAMEPDAQQRYLFSLEHDPDFAEPGKPVETREQFEARLQREAQSRNGPDGVTDQFYYSGIDIGKAYEDLARMLKPVRELFTPEHETPGREAAGAVIGEQIGKMQRENQRMAQSWYRKQQLDDTLKFAYETDQRKAFWAAIPKGQRMKMFEQHEAGLSTGNRVADRLFQLHDGLMRALARIDQMRGFTYNLRDSYIYHALEKTGDIDKLAAEIKRRKWGDPDFMHAREIPTVEMLHALGFRLKTYNLEELDQMRLEASNRAEMRASSLEGLNHTGEIPLAIARSQMAKLRKNNPDLAEQIMEQSHPDVWRSPRAQGKDDPHQTYYLHKDAHFMLDRAASPVKWHPVMAGVVQGLGAIKQRSVGLNLGWSLYHQVHMLSIGASDMVALSAYSKSLAGTAKLGDWAQAFDRYVYAWYRRADPESAIQPETSKLVRGQGWGEFA